MVDVRPPKEAQRIARYALEVAGAELDPPRPGIGYAQVRRQEIQSGVARARSIARGNVQPDAEKIVAFFQRFHGAISAALAERKTITQSRALHTAALHGGGPMARAALKAVRRDAKQRKRRRRKRR